MTDTTYHVISHHKCRGCDGAGHQPKPKTSPSRRYSWLEQRPCRICQGMGYTVRQTDLLTALEALGFWKRPPATFESLDTEDAPC